MASCTKRFGEFFQAAAKIVTVTFYFSFYHKSVGTVDDAGGYYSDLSEFSTLAPEIYKGTLPRKSVSSKQMWGCLMPSK
jgi:hypothetical protein